MNRYEFYKKLDEARGTTSETFLCHYGIIGQKWGQRRWQNADGTFNEEGKERYFGTGKYKPVSKEDQKIGGKTGDYHYSWHKGQMFNTEYQNPDGSLTKKGLKALNRAQKHPKWFTTKNVISEDLLHEWEKNMTKDQFKTDSDKEKEEKIKQAETEARINEIKSNIKTTKELSGSKINEQELKDIIKELNDFDKHDFERNHKEEYNKVADIGLDALNKAEDIDDYEKIGDDDSRMWFMWEDQTDGLGELAYLYTKGYSKDYVKQYLDTYNSLPYDEKRKYTDSYSAADFVASEFHRGGDAYIDALYNNSNQKDADSVNDVDQKIGGFISDVKINKKVKQLNKEIEKLENDPIGQKRLFEEYLNDVGKGGYDQLNEYLHQDRDYKFLEQDVVEKYYKSIEKNTRTQKFEDASAKAGIIKALSETDNMIEIASELDKYVNNYKENSINDDIIAIRLYDSGYNDYSIDNAIKSFDINAKRLRKATDEYLSKDNKSYDKLSENSKSKLFEESTGGIAVNNGRNTIRKYLEEANRSDMQDNYKKYSSRANKIMDKLKPSCERKDHNEPNGWYYVWEAINNLGYDNVSYDELSQADWNKINAEINKLKK